MKDLINKITNKDRLVKLYKCEECDKITNAFIELLTEALNNYYLLPNAHRMSAEKYYREEIKIAEEAVGMKWNELKKRGNQ